MGLAWLRLWTEMPTDPKFRTVARQSGQPLSAVIAFYVLLLTNAAQSPPSQVPGATDLDDEDAASALDLSLDHVRAMREAMQGRLLDGNVLSGWTRRQMPSTTRAAERARAWRAKRAQAAVQSEQRPTRSVPPPLPAEPPHSPVAASLSEPPSSCGEAQWGDPQGEPQQATLPDMGLDHDTAPSQSGMDVAKTSLRSRGRRGRRIAPDFFTILVPGCDATLWRRWVEYRKAIRKPYTLASVEAGQKLLASFGHDQAKVVEVSIANGWQGLFPLKSGGKPQSNAELYQRNHADAERWAAQMMACESQPPLEGDYREQS